MLTIELSRLRFFARHGLYKEEQALGAEYEVNLSVQHHPRVLPVRHIEDTLDYTAVYLLVKEHMQKPTPLLETVATNIAHEILTKFSQAEEIKITVTKIHPPIIAFEGSVGVSYLLKRTI